LNMSFYLIYFRVIARDQLEVESTVVDIVAICCFLT